MYLLLPCNDFLPISVPGRIACTQCRDADYCYRCRSSASLSLCLCLCLGHSIELCKNGCTYQDVVWGLTHRSPRNHGDTDRTNTFAASRGDMTAMRPFAKLLWTSVRFTTACLVCHIVVVPYVRNGFRFEERSRFLTIFISFRTSATTTVC